MVLTLKQSTYIKSSKERMTTSLIKLNKLLCSLYIILIEMHVKQFIRQLTKRHNMPPGWLRFKKICHKIEELVRLHEEPRPVHIFDR